MKVGFYLVNIIPVMSLSNIWKKPSFRGSPNVSFKVTRHFPVCIVSGLLCCQRDQTPGFAKDVKVSFVLLRRSEER